jgi:hypothetical protein
MQCVNDPIAGSSDGRTQYAHESQPVMGVFDRPQQIDRIDDFFNRVEMPLPFNDIAKPMAP